MLALLVAVFPLVSQANDAGQHMLWQVESNGGVMYLLGSVHALRPDDYPLAEAYERAYQLADRVMLEINPQQDTPERIQQLSQKLGFISEGESLQDYLSSDGYRRAMLLAKQLGLNTRVLNHLEPWLGALTVVAEQMMRAGFQMMMGVDNHFADRAIRDKKPLSGLETADYQISLFDGLSAEVQEAFLLQSLEEAGDFQNDMAELVGFWLAGDIDELYRITQEDLKEYPEVHEIILLQRNRNWIPQLERELKHGGTVLVVVGALHLVGEDGVVQLLQKRGYKITRL
ncbi:MAG: TraB/GumN family protein, partial [Gammaproteobacteria bacterium]